MQRGFKKGVWGPMTFILSLSMTWCQHVSPQKNARCSWRSQGGFWADKQHRQRHTRRIFLVGEFGEKPFYFDGYLFWLKMVVYFDNGNVQHFSFPPIFFSFRICLSMSLLRCPQRSESGQDDHPEDDPNSYWSRLGDIVYELTDVWYGEWSHSPPSFAASFAFLKINIHSGNLT